VRRRIKHSHDVFLSIFLRISLICNIACISVSTLLQNMVPGLYDPLGFSKNRSEEAKAKGRVSEIKNGRLAMIGVAGLYAAATIPGSVPLQPDC
jgi:hypothetical protein